MDIIDFALKMELDGKAFYEKQAAATTDPELKKMLIVLADEEERHYRFFQRLKNGEVRLAAQEIDLHSPSLTQAKNIFQRLSQRDHTKPLGSDVVSAWTEALRIEQRAEKFYRENAELESDRERQDLLNLIADEELNHVHMIDGILTYLKFPDTFAASAQFRNFMSWEGR